MSAAIRRSWLLRCRLQLRLALFSFISVQFACGRWVDVAASVLQHDLASRRLHLLLVELIVRVHCLNHVAVDLLQIFQHFD